MSSKHSSDPGFSAEEWAGRAVDEAMSRRLTGRSFGAWAGGIGELTPERRAKLHEAAEETRRRRRERRTAVGNGLSVIVR